MFNWWKNKKNTDEVRWKIVSKKTRSRLEECIQNTDEYILSDTQITDIQKMLPFFNKILYYLGDWTIPLDEVLEPGDGYERIKHLYTKAEQAFQSRHKTKNIRDTLGEYKSTLKYISARKKVDTQDRTVIRECADFLRTLEVYLDET